MKSTTLHPWHLLVAILAGIVNREQQRAQITSMAVSLITSKGCFTIAYDASPGGPKEFLHLPCPAYLVLLRSSVRLPSVQMI